MQILKPKAIFLIMIMVGLIMIESAPCETLDDAWAISLASDHSLKAARDSADAAQFEVSAAKGARLPALNLNSGYTLLNNEPGVILNGFEATTAENDFLTYSATVAVPIYTHFRITNGIKAAESNREAAGFEQKALEQDIKLRVAETYIAVLLSQKNVEVVQSHVQSLTAIAVDVKNLHDQGMVPVNDLLSAQVSLADAKQKELNARNQLDTARAAYNRILVRSLDSAVEIEPLEFAAFEEPLEELTDRAIQTRAELTLLSKQSEGLEQLAAAQQAATGPQVLLSGGTNYTQNSHQVHESLWSANLTLSWDIFDGNIASHKSSATLKRAGSVREQRYDYESMIRLNVRNAWLKMQESQERIKVAEEALKQADENLNVSRNRYQEGVGTNTDVLNAESLRINSRVNYENAYYDFGLAIMRLKRAMGEI